MTEAEERAALHARLLAVLPGRDSPSAGMPLDQLRRFVESYEAGAAAVALRGGLHARWAHDDECAALKRR